MSVLRTTTSYAVTVALLGIAGPAAGYSSTSGARERVLFPQGSQIRIVGHGYGHAHGMSQYGAKGAAERGLSAAKIMAFYYPGTQPGTVGGAVTVHLTADTDNATTIAARDGASVRDLRSKQTWALPTRRSGHAVDQWRLDATPSGDSRVSYHTDAWHTWRRWDGDGAFAGGSRGLTLLTGGSATTYRGDLQSRHVPGTGSRARVTVDKLPLESYLRGVVPREMPALWKAAAVRSQAIAARTYAAFERAQPLTRVYQICDTSLCQVYGGKSSEHPAADEAVTATKGRIRTWHGDPAFTQFSASNGGWTAAGSQPYLVAEQDPYDTKAVDPYFRWSLDVTPERFGQLVGVGRVTEVVVDSRDGNGDFGGRLVQVTIRGTGGVKTMSGEALRSALGIRSTWADFRLAPSGSARRGGADPTPSVLGPPLRGGGLAHDVT